jgi:hypothetical protein
LHNLPICFARLVACRVRPLKLDGSVTDNDGKVHNDEGKVDLPKDAVGSCGDLSFAAFSLTHAECGPDGVIELQLCERLLLAWCPSFAALETFGSLDLPSLERRRDVRLLLRESCIRRS